MIAELMAANAAFAVIKETVQNGGDIMAAGRRVVGAAAEAIGTKEEEEDDRA